MKKLKVLLLLLAAALMCVVAAGGAPLPPGDANTIVSWSGALPTDMVFYDKTGQEYYYWQPDGTRTTYTPPATMTCILAGGESYSCDILWESPDLLPADGTVQKLGGTLTPGDGFNIAEEVQPPAFSVFATAQDMPTQQLAAFYIELPRTGGVTDVGISVTPPDDLPKTAICELSGAAASFYLPIEWDWDSIDFNAAGLYYVSCHPKNLPDCFTLSLSLPSYLFCVMDPGFIDLSYCAGTDFIGNPLFRWSWDAADVSEIRLFRKTGVTGIWEEHSGELSELFPPDMLFSEEAAAIYSNTSLTIFKADLDPDSVYFYQMQYGDRFSNVLQIITAPNGSISYLLGGDRGVADRGDQLLPGLGQPAPEVPEEDATGNTSVPQNEPLYEWLTESTTTLSGSRLRALLAANPHSVLFKKKGIAIELQSSELEALNFSDSSLFSVTIEQPDANSFRFSTLLDHKALTALSAMVSLPYLPADGEDAGRLACYDVNGTQIGKATYDPALGIITFSVPSSGTYFISTQKADAVTPSDLPPTNPANGAAGRILSNDKAGASVIMWVTMVAAAMFAVFLLIAGLCRRLGGCHHD